MAQLSSCGKWIDDSAANAEQENTPKIERIIVLLSASPEGEARLPMPKGMAYKE
jgi:hypothetical protein